MELEAALKKSLEEHETKKNEISLLQKQVLDFEQKLQQGGEKISVKVIYTCLSLEPSNLCHVINC